MNKKKMVSVSDQKIKKTLYLLVGILSLFLGCIGAFLPLLPSFPFLLLSATCFAKSSKRLHHWLVETDMYKNTVLPLKKDKKMKFKNKLIIMISVTLLMSIGFVMMHEVLIGQIILLMVWLFHMFYFLFKIKTIRS